MITQENYREYPAIHYSLLSKLARDPSTALSENKDFSDGMMFGDVLDILLTQGQEEFDKKYIVAKVERPTGQMGDFIDELIRLKDKELAYQTVGFKRDSIDKVLIRFETEGRDYYNFVINTEGKKVISIEMLMKVNEAINTLKTHQFTSIYFTDHYKVNNIEDIYQMPILFDINGEECKALLDRVIVNHNTRIVEPFDIKTMGDYINTFPTSFVKWRYDLQAAFYTEALKQKYPDYEIKPFKFIVISSLQLKKPLIYTCTENDLLVGRYGGVNVYNKKVKGWEQLLDDYIWHLENDLWDYPREVYERNGEIDLDVFYFLLH